MRTALSHLNAPEVRAPPLRPPSGSQGPAEGAIPCKGRGWGWGGGAGRDAQPPPSPRLASPPAVPARHAEAPAPYCSVTVGAPGTRGGSARHNHAHGHSPHRGRLKAPQGPSPPWSRARLPQGPTGRPRHAHTAHAPQSRGWLAWPADLRGGARDRQQRKEDPNNSPPSSKPARGAPRSGQRRPAGSCGRRRHAEGPQVPRRAAPEAGSGATPARRPRRRGSGGGRAARATSGPPGLARRLPGWRAGGR